MLSRVMQGLVLVMLVIAGCPEKNHNQIHLKGAQEQGNPKVDESLLEDLEALYLGGSSGFINRFPKFEFERQDVRLPEGMGTDGGKSVISYSHTTEDEIATVTILVYPEDDTYMVSCPIEWYMSARGVSREDLVTSLAKLFRTHDGESSDVSNPGFDHIRTTSYSFAYKGVEVIFIAQSPTDESDLGVVVNLAFYGNEP